MIFAAYYDYKRRSMERARREEEEASRKREAYRLEMQEARRKGVKEGREEGFHEGRMEGLKEGIEIGIRAVEQGRDLERERFRHELEGLSQRGIRIPPEVALLVGLETGPFP